MEIIKKHALVFFWTASVLLCVSAVMAVYIGLDYAGDKRERESIASLYVSEMKCAALKTADELERGEVYGAYHYAVSASEYAKKAGLSEDADMLLVVSESVRAGEGSEYTDMLREFVTRDNTGETADGERNNVNEPAREKISEYELRRAGESANAMFGVKNTLKPVMSSVRGGSIVFSCENAYAVVDIRSGIPREGAISLTPKPAALGDGECIAAAEKYLSELYPASVVSGASLKDVSGAGGVSLTAGYEIGGRRVSVVVERSRGRLVGLSTAEPRL